MKKLIAVLLLVMAITIMAHIANAKTAVVPFSVPSTETSAVCIVADTAPDIAGRWTRGELTTLSGQCTTEPGQTEVAVANVTPGSTWYFAGFMQDAGGERSAFSNEVSVAVLAAPIQVVPLPPMEINGQTFTIEVTIK